MLYLGSKHVDNWASLALKSTKYRFSYLKPLNIKLEPSTLSGGATGYAGYAPAYPVCPASNKHYILLYMYSYIVGSLIRPSITEAESHKAQDAAHAARLSLDLSTYTYFLLALLKNVFPFGPSKSDIAFLFQKYATKKRYNLLDGCLLIFIERDNFV